MVAAVLFDMDGLMFDTERLAWDAWMRVGEENGWPITGELIDRMRGVTAAYSSVLFTEALDGKVDFHDARTRRVRYMETEIRANGLPVKLGLPELLTELRRRNIPAALATSSAAETAQWYLELSGTAEFFSARVCGAEVPNSKPAPDVFLTAADKLGIPPERCMVLEDSPSGIQSAHAAGCLPVMVPDLSPATPELRTLCAAVIDSLSEAIPLLDVL